MAYTTITAATIGLADGDTSPQRLDGTVRITPRFPSAATTDGFTVSGPVVVAVTGGDMPQTMIPAMVDATGLVEFHLYDRNAGPVKMPPTEIPLEPDTTISLHDYLPVGVDLVSGASFIKGETGPIGPKGERGIQGPEGDKGDTGATGPKGDTGNTGPKGEVGNTGPIGPQGQQGPQGTPGEDGIDGTGVEIKGDLPSVGDLPSSGVEGDAYLIDGDLHVWDVLDSAWVNVGPIKGPQGQTGPQGPEGIQGPIGPEGPEGPEGPQGPAGADGAVGPQGPEGPQGDQGPEGPQGEPGVDGADAPRPDLISELVAPVVIAHRGGGALVYPEEGMRGMLAAVDGGFLPEMDIQFLSDGTPVLCHDSTVDRTMTGVTGAPSSLTLNQWRNARIRPVYEGGRDDRPLTFAAALDRLGGTTVLVAEVTPGATEAETDSVISMVLDRGLERSVILQSFDYANAQRVAAAGLEVVFLCTSTSPQPFATIKADGINYLGPDRSMSVEDMDAATADGLMVVPYTVQKPSQVEALPASVFGYFSDDPWGSSGRVPRASEPGWAAGDGWPIARNESVLGDGTKAIEDHQGLTVTGGNLYIPLPLDGAGGWKYALTSISMEHMTGGPIAPPYSIYAKFLVGRSHSVWSNNVGFTLYRNSLDPEAPFRDEAEPGQEGFTFAVRRDGQVNGWIYTDGVAASGILAKSRPTETPVMVNEGESGICEALLEVSGDGVVRFTNLTSGISADASSVPAMGGPLVPMLRVSVQDATVLDVAIYHSPDPLDPLPVE